MKLMNLIVHTIATKMKAKNKSVRKRINDFPFNEQNKASATF